jgi:hypothetical protein
MAGNLQTYENQAIHEDLLDLIADVSPDSNPLTTMFGTTDAKGTIHQWTEDYLSRPTSNAGEVEGSDATFSDLTQPQKRTNIAQIIRSTFRVTEDERAANVAGMSDPYEYQKAKALRTWKNKLEFAIIRSTLSSGASGVAPTMAGIQAIVTSHYTNLLSGSSLSEAHLNSMVLGVASDVGDDDIFDTLVTTLALRQKVSTFTAGNTKYVDASEKRLTRKVMVYESEFNVMRIFGHKDVYASSATPGPAVLGLKEDSWKVAYYRKPKHTELAKTGSSDKGMIEGNATLEFRAERSNAYSSGFALNG